jgi:DNA relaxase NicK
VDVSASRKSISINKKLAERVGFDNPETSIYCPIKGIACNILNKTWLIIVAPFSHRCMRCCWVLVFRHFRYHWYHP